jgi:hypothetical protein
MAYDDIKTSPGMFWCRSHLEERPLSERSPHDRRYCNACYAVMHDSVTPKAAEKDKAGSFSPAGDVTALTPTRDIVDAYIKNALGNGKTAREKSCRAIAKGLETLNVYVSHMTVHRRMKELTGAESK